MYDNASRMNGFSHKCVGYGLDSTLTCLLQGFVAEEHSEVPNNPVDQLPSNVWHLRYATHRNGFSHECVGYGLNSALTYLLQGFVAEGVSALYNPTFQLTSDG